MASSTTSGTAAERQRVVVRAPATSANLGPGFDCLGLALDLWNEVTAEPAEDAEWPEHAGVSGQDLVRSSIEAVFELRGRRAPALKLRSRIDIPMGRGLGSSAAAICCGVLLGSAYLDEPLAPDELLALATRLEGHPDNVAPALLGGVRVAVLGEDGSVLQCGVPARAGLTAVVFVPRATLPTKEARAVLPKQVPFRDALFNVGRSSLLVAALASGQTDVLPEAMRDSLHQDYRAPLFPPGKQAIEHALAAGALGACVSGAGPSILALCQGARMARQVQAHLTAWSVDAGVPGAALRLALTRQGAHVVTPTPGTRLASAVG